VAAVIERVAARWQLGREVEITLEANPTSAEARRLADFAAAGVNRVSLGVQALDDRALAFLGRAHDVGEALAAVAAARRLFARTSLDLVYARPGQTVAGWRAELGRALAHAGGHLSAYQLTIEKGTPFFAAHRRGAFTLPGEALAAALYDATQDVLEAAAMPAYEISNHSRAGEECRHNLAYWRYRDYAGIGPGAHGRLTLGGVVCASENLPGPDAWIEAVEARGHSRRRLTPLDRADVLVEVLLMGLRLTSGIARDDFEARLGRPIEDALDAGAVRALSEAGLVALDRRGLRATDAGRRVLDGVVARLVPAAWPAPAPAQNTGTAKSVGAGSSTSNERGATR
jgi:oxygen-independent coproporphyrinogen-3 oxidase